MSKEQNVNITLIFQLFEVINQIIYNNIDHPSLKLIMEKDFAPLIEQSRELSAHQSDFINQCTNVSCPEEIFSQDVELLTNYILASKGLVKRWQFKRAIKAVKAVVNNKG